MRSLIAEFHEFACVQELLLYLQGVAVVYERLFLGLNGVLYVRNLQFSPGLTTFYPVRPGWGLADCGTREYRTGISLEENSYYILRGCF